MKLLVKDETQLERRLQVQMGVVVEFYCKGCDFVESMTLPRDDVYTFLTTRRRSELHYLTEDAISMLEHQMCGKCFGHSFGKD